MDSVRRDNADQGGRGPTLEDATAVLASQPFNAHLGTQIVAFEPGRAELEIPVTPGILQQHGFVQGGVLAFLADNALTFAGGSALGPMVVTRGFSIEFLRPGIGVKVRAEAHVIETASRTAVCECKVSVVTDDGDETVCAVAQGTIARMSGEGS
jgi:uncharacterized protein (TIGR00369 family)